MLHYDPLHNIHGDLALSVKIQKQTGKGKSISFLKSQTVTQAKSETGLANYYLYTQKQKNNKTSQTI